MQAFKGETKQGKGAKSVKRMISECTSLVNKTRKRSKFVDESLAKAEKNRKAQELKSDQLRLIEAKETKKRKLSPGQKKSTF